MAESGDYPAIGDLIVEVYAGEECANPPGLYTGELADTATRAERSVKAIACGGAVLRMELW
ncbi:hypothetical protein [Nocardia sp. NPDC059239]|uniref:hypothetical protein n=1 Tax=unclassified Nocardia TaxID=2637762 RepID=UPI00367E37C6